MIDTDQLCRDLALAGLQNWDSTLPPLLDAKFEDRAYGDLPKWKSTLEQLPVTSNVALNLSAANTGGQCPSLSDGQRENLRDTLMQLRPWRKGPFNLCGIDIDSEWRSDLKWQRLENHIAPLAGRNILDVGSGNGYYALRMRGAGANLVIGVDPTLLFVCQFLAIKTLLDVSRVYILPFRLQELPAPCPRFDTTFSMGVLYHQRHPKQHLVELRETLRPGGELVLETLVWPGDRLEIHEPEDRYARMRNVWHLPTVPMLRNWLLQTGFADIRIIDVTATSTDEQRSTDWMPFESLAQALDPSDATRTIEGLPAPTRAIVLANS